MQDWKKAIAKLMRELDVLQEQIAGRAALDADQEQLLEALKAGKERFHSLIERIRALNPGDVPAGSGAKPRVGAATELILTSAHPTRHPDTDEDNRLLVDSAPDPVFIQTNGCFAYANTKAADLFGAESPEALAGLVVEERFHPDQRDAVHRKLHQQREERIPTVVMESVFLRLDGSPVDVEISAMPTVYSGSLGNVLILRDITGRRQAEEDLRWIAEVNAAVAALYQPLTSIGTPVEAITGEVLKQAQLLTSSQFGYVSEIDPVTGSNIIPTLSQMVPGKCTIQGQSQRVVFNPGPDGRYPGLWGESMNTRQAFYTNSPAEHPAARGTPEGHIPIERFLSVPVLLGGELVGQIALANPERDYTERDLKSIQRLAEYYGMALLRLRKELELRKANELLARTQKIAHLASWEYVLHSREMLWSDEMYQIMGFPPGSYVTVDHMLGCLPREDTARVQETLRAAIASKTPFQVEFRMIRPDGQVRYIRDEGDVVCDEAGQPVRLYGTSLDVTERHRAEEERQKQLERLEALHEIDRAVAASQDMKIMCDTLLRQVTRQLQVDAADLLLYDAAMQTLNFARGLGFQTNLAERVSLAVGRGLAGQILLTRRKILSNPLPEEILNQDRGLFAREGFQFYVGLPLIAKGQVKGVLEVFHRAPLEVEPEWLSYLEILAGQAAIAIDNLQMLENLQRANTDLSMTYNTTIEGWSRALDLRDKETEGHSRRVMELTVRTAQALGIRGDALVHIYHGALLHDIGKMGVPDQILHKPSSLSPEEWEKMRQHPTLAFELLSPIPYLRHALEIPYCHHEKWDGSGYPRGLSGVQIPLSARIFAVVDVWDALLSDRPYRPAWPKDKVVEYIQDQSGKHFDPEVVEMFLDVVKELEG